MARWDAAGPVRVPSTPHRSLVTKCADQKTMIARKTSTYEHAPTPSEAHNPTTLSARLRAARKQGQSRSPYLSPADQPQVTATARRDCAAPATTRANLGYWDAAADEYQAEHGDFLGDAEFVWGPEGLTEAVAGLLGPVTGRSVLEIGCGAGQCSRWLLSQGAQPVGVDLSHRQLQHSLRLDDAAGTAVPVLVADACALPLADASFDLACSAYGAVPFVADSA